MSKALLDDVLEPVGSLKKFRDTLEGTLNSEEASLRLVERI